MGTGQTICLVASAVAFASASSVFPGGPLVVLETIKNPPPRFVSHGAAPSDVNIDFRIALAQNNLSGLEAALQDVSTPGNANYGQWLSRDEVASYVQPTAETYTLVQQWLASHSVTATNASYAGDWLQVTLPIATANSLLGTDFEDFENTKTGLHAVRTLSYSIPSALQGHVTLVHPTVNFPINGTLPPKQQKIKYPKSPSLPVSCQNDTTPQCIQDLYGIPTTPVRNPEKLSLFVAEYEGEWFDESDLQSFLVTLRPDVNPNTTFAIVSVANGTNSQDPDDAGLEACLDFEYTVGIATGVPTTLLTIGPTLVFNDTQFYTAVLDGALYLAGTEEPPSVITTSYGSDEPTDITAALAKAICNVYLQATIRGVSVIYSSGDGGVAGNHGEFCPGGVFLPVFPATCPYVTSVGGTQLGLGDATQVAVNYTEQFWSASGGFSTYFDRAWYQELAVAPYVAGLGDLYEGLYNKTGRGFPDVSALAVDFTVYCGGYEYIGEIGGTSASSPTFASIVSLLNDVRISAGKPVLGFLNPLLYTVPEAFTDILEGNNPGCNTTGFYATKGWDATTGLGTPIFEKLKEAVLLL